MGLLQGGIQVSNEYAKFLRDFADANIDSFEDEQLHMLRNAAREIELLRTQLAAKTDELDLTINDLQEVAVERDSARWEVCELSGNGSIDSAMRVAKERGWNLTDEDEVFTYVCDHCGDTIDSNNVFFYYALPQDIASANKGESATVCRKCCEMIDANANNQDFRTTDMG
jgi:hypothetical protein